MREVLKHFMLSSIPKTALLVSVPVRILSSDWKAASRDIPVVREYHQGSRSQLAMEQIEES